MFLLHFMYTSFTAHCFFTVDLKLSQTLAFSQKQKNVNKHQRIS